jgi:hypothetical protein
MYLLYSIHPKTLNLTLRGSYKEYDEATEALQRQVQIFLSYKGQKNLLYINNKQEMLTNSCAQYFLKISNKFPNKISVYEKKEVDNSGVFFSGVKQEIQKVMVFSFKECAWNMKDQADLLATSSSSSSSSTSVSTIDNDDFRNRLQNATNKTTQMSHGTHVKYISELKEVLSARRNYIN